MKALIQRVSKASVSVDGEIISSIGTGLCVLIGIKRDDGVADMKYIIRKILNAKIFEDDKGKKWNASVKDKKAMPAQESETFYMNFITELREQYVPELIKDGKFGAKMEVSIQNNGPVTLEIVSQKTSDSNIENEETSD